MKARAIGSCASSGGPFSLVAKSCTTKKMHLLKFIRSRCLKNGY